MAIKPADATFVFTSGSYVPRYLQAKHQASICCSSPRALQRRDDRPLQGHGHQAHGRNDGRHEPQGGEEGAQGGLIVSLWPGQSVEDFALPALPGLRLRHAPTYRSVKGWLAEKGSVDQGEILIAPPPTTRALAACAAGALSFEPHRRADVRTRTGWYRRLGRVRGCAAHASGNAPSADLRFRRRGVRHVSKIRMRDESRLFS